MVKFDRKALADDNSKLRLTNPDIDADDNTAKITLAFSDGDALKFYGEDTIKTKPAKVKKPKKK